MNLGETGNISKPATSPNLSAQLRLPTDPESKKRLMLAGFAALVIFYAYFISKTCLLGIAADNPSVSLVQWLMVNWGSKGGDYAHGYVVPVIAVGLAYWQWKRKLHAVPMNVSNAGLGVIITAMVLYWFGVKAGVPRVIAGSMVLLIFGLILYLCGWGWAKELWFPCAFLVFGIPLTFLDQIVAFPLRMFVTKFSVGTLNVLGMDVIQKGTGIESK